MEATDQNDDLLLLGDFSANAGNQLNANCIGMFGEEVLNDNTTLRS